MLEQQLQVARIVQLCGIDHGVVVAKPAAIHDLVSAGIWICPVFKKCAEAVQTACA